MRTRFGLHMGETIVGNLGSSDRMDYTALGATVNLASRLEGLNKYYGTQLLVSQAVAGAVRECFLLRAVDIVQVKGTSKPVRIYELLAQYGEPYLEPANDDESYCVLWEQAFGQYLEQRWDQALARFQALSDKRPEDKVARIFVERLSGFKESPPPDTWDGTQVFQMK